MAISGSRFLSACAGALVLALSPAVAASDASFDLVRLIRNEQANVKDAGGWAADILSGLADAGIPATRENVCSVVAVVSQESGFIANPQVKNLGVLAEKALRDKFGAIPVAGAAIIAYLEKTPQPPDSFMDRIRSAKTERDLDLTYRAMVDYAAARTETGILLSSGLLNRYVEDRNDVSTIGSMQVSVAFAVETEREKRWFGHSLADIYRIRDELYTRKGGLKYGILQLLGYETGYHRKIYRFADYNAGRYASRNAAFQFVIGKLSGRTLARDGDLLAYDGNRKPSSKATRTEKALRKAVSLHGLPLTETDIRTDLLKEKSSAFSETRTFTLLHETYRAVAGKPAPFAMVPDITLESVKIKNHMTTQIFADRVNRRYQRCMAAK